MCDIFDSLPIWQQEDIQKSFELIAAKDEQDIIPQAATEESLADLATESEPEKPLDDFGDDEIPF